MSTRGPTEEWSDEDVYYWIYEIGIGEKHAVAFWENAINGQTLLSLKKSQLLDYCKSLNKDTNHNLWLEIKKLQKNSRKSIFRSKPKPSPLAPDYQSDEDFSDFSDSGDDGDTCEPNETSLPDLLKARLKEFKEQQQQEQQQGGDTMDEYIVPDDNSVDEPQDEYEEFEPDGTDDPAAQEELYLPPNETNHEDEALPPPLPSRIPLGHGGDNNSNAAPVLPPRPGENRPLKKQQQIPVFQPAAPTGGEDSEEEYVVPASQGDPMHPQAQIDSDCGDFYEPPKESNTQDFGGDYISPDAVPKRPDGRKSPMNTIPRPPMAKPPLPSNPGSVGKATDMSRRPPAALPPSNQFTSNGTNSTNRFTGSTGTSNNRFANSTPNNHSKLGNKPGFSSFREASNRQPGVAPKPKLGGSLHQIKHELNSIKPPVPRPISHTPSYRPSSPKPAAPEPSKPEIPRPRQVKPQDKNDMSNCDWFRVDVDRETVASALQNHRVDGAFLVRPSGRKPEYPYTLQLLYKGRIKNLPIGKRLDKKFALGAPKEGETRFDTVKELVEYHRRHEVVLANNEGKTCLLETVPLP